MELLYKSKIKLNPAMLCARQFNSPRSMSTALGLCEYGMFLYTASRIFSLTCVMVSQFRTLTGISGLFSFSGLTQFKIWRGKKEDEDDKMLGSGR